MAALRRQHRTDPALLAAVLGCSALAGLTAWRDVPAMAFELAWLPRGLRRPPGAVTAHDEPIRVGIGQVRYFHRWPRNPITLLVRRLSVGRSLAALAPRQPPSGGFLESAAWTGFLLMGLASTGRVEHPIARRALAFLLDTVRGDASWPVVTNRSAGNTAFAVNALASASGDVAALGCQDWLLSCQRSEGDVPRGALPGGWACTDGRGALPDVASTAAALRCFPCSCDRAPTPTARGSKPLPPPASTGCLRCKTTTAAGRPISAARGGSQAAAWTGELRLANPPVAGHALARRQRPRPDGPGTAGIADLAILDHGPRDRRIDSPRHGLPGPDAAARRKLAGAVVRQCDLSRRRKPDLRHVAGRVGLSRS